MIDTIEIDGKVRKLSSLDTKQLRYLLAAGFKGEQHNAIMLEYRHRPDKKVKRRL
jgi:hypothetical protein